MHIAQMLMKRVSLPASEVGGGAARSRRETSGKQSCGSAVCKYQPAQDAKDFCADLKNFSWCGIMWGLSWLMGREKAGLEVPASR